MLASQPSAKRDLALIGVGYWGQHLARNFSDLDALHTICDPDQAVLHKIGSDYANAHKTTSFEQVLQQAAIRKIAIAAPAVAHYKLAKAGILAGKDVFVEKPLCLDLREASELVALAEKHRCILMVGHLLRYHPCVEKLQELITSGALGKLYYITSNRLNLGKIRREENALWSFAPHDISTILSLAGSELPERVQCTGGGYLNHAVADTTLTSLRFANGIRAHVYVSWLNPFKEQKLTVVGSGGMAVFDDTRPWHEKLTLHREFLTWSNGQVPTVTKSHGESVPVAETEPLREECLHFINCCGERQKPRTDGQEGLRVLQVLQTAQSSLEKDGEPIRPLIAESWTGLLDYDVHPTAIIEDAVIIGKGTKIWHFAHVCAGARIGERCILGQNTFIATGVAIGNNVKVQNNVSVYAGTTIEDDVFLGPSCVLTNISNPRSQVNRQSLYEATILKRGATVGANATVICGISLGTYCFIAAGAVVTRDVPDYALMIGAPARQRGWMSRHGHRLRPDPDGLMVCPESKLRYREVGPGKVRCLDLDEDAPLPEPMRVGCRSYETYRIKGA
jgi:UDP-2-acetamido-3-amino-2,3-dideoxy-glucuronate N-acetyltransferase